MSAESGPKDFSNITTSRKPGGSDVREYHSLALRSLREGLASSRISRRRSQKPKVDCVASPQWAREPRTEDKQGLHFHCHRTIHLLRQTMRHLWRTFSRMTNRQVWVRQDQLNKRLHVWQRILPSYPIAREVVDRVHRLRD